MRKRLRKFLNYEGVTPRKAEILCDFTNGTLNNFFSGTNIGSDKVEKIGQSFPNLNMHWLVTGEGSMLLFEGSQLNDSGRTEDPKEALFKWMSMMEEKIISMQKEISNLEALVNK